MIGEDERFDGRRTIIQFASVEKFIDHPDAVFRSSTKIRDPVHCGEKLAYDLVVEVIKLDLEHGEKQALHLFPENLARVGQINFQQFIHTRHDLRHACEGYVPAPLVVSRGVSLTGER